MSVGLGKTGAGAGLLSGDQSTLGARGISHRTSRCAWSRTFMQQEPALVAAFVRCCYLLRCHPDADPESFLSSHSIVQAIEASDEFFSACSSDVSDDNEIFYDVSPPYKPLVGS
jgi:hypothetical protein